REIPGRGARSGDIMVVANGGSAFLYVVGREQAVVGHAVHFLQSQPFCGVVFTRTPVVGAFSLDVARIHSPSAPDIVVALRWQPAENTNGTPGLIYSD